MVKKELNYSLSAQNTFRMKVSCACYIEYESISDLESIDFQSLPKPIVSLGEGSNILFTKDFEGTILHSKINYIKYYDIGADNVPLAVGSGVKWDDLVQKTCEDNLWGLENLSLIPGTVGGAAVQNIGAYGVEVKDLIAGVTCFDIETKEKVSIKVAQCGYAYRDSIFKQEEYKNRYIVTGVLFRLSRVPQPKLEYGALKNIFSKEDVQNPLQIRKAIIKIREEKLPAVEKIGSAGSFFKNPIISPVHFTKLLENYENVPHYIVDGGFIKVPAAWLIEQCGFKGMQLGGVKVYEKQALVIVNHSLEATPSEVLALEAKIIEGVKEKFGIELHPEVEHL